MADEGITKIFVYSTTRVKSAIVFSLMIDGSGSHGCRIFGRLRPVRIVGNRGAIRHQTPAGIKQTMLALALARETVTKGPEVIPVETRVALIVAERGLTEKQMAKYFVRRRKNCKPRFDHWAFAKAQNISTDWLFDGDLRSHPRGPVRKAARTPVPPRSVLLQKFKDALEKAVDEKGLQFLTSYLHTLADGGAA